MIFKLIFAILVIFNYKTSIACETEFILETSIDKIKKTDELSKFKHQRKIILDSVGKDMGFDGLYDENITIKAYVIKDNNSCPNQIIFKAELKPIMYISPKYLTTSCQYSRIKSHELNHHQFVLFALKVLNTEFEKIVDFHSKNKTINKENINIFVKKISSNLMSNYSFYVAEADKSIDNENYYYYESSLCYKEKETVVNNEKLEKLDVDMKTQQKIIREIIN